MSYTVRWSRRALDALAEIWLANPGQRVEINQAAASIDRLLAISPNEQGESRNDNHRILFLPPLVVNFRVDDANRAVRILGIRRLKRRGSS